MNVPAVLDHDAWKPWHPAELGQQLRGLSRPWCIVGGWALDLWHGHQTRDHDDLEFAVLREDLGVFRKALAELDFYTAGSGIVEHLPDNEAPPEGIFQVWCQDVAEQCWRVDMMIEPGTPSTWAFRRDPGIARPRIDMVGTTSGGLPYLKPAGVLLFKAKHQRPKDEVDFENALPKLTLADRTWLKHSLEATHPGHEWVRFL